MKRLQIVFLLLIQLALLAGCGSSMDEKGNLDTTCSHTIRWEAK